MPNYVCKGAKLKCSFGSSQSDLNVMHFTDPVKLHGEFMANIQDYKPMINIMPFGQCKSLANPVVAAATAANYGVLKEMPCMPNIVAPWMSGKMNYLVKGQPALMDNGKCMCTWAGLIQIADDGQKVTGGTQKTGDGAQGVEIKEEKEEKTPKCIVYFRPHKDYNGEFGFDWLRDEVPPEAQLTDKEKTGYKAYEDIIEAGYGKTGDLGKAEAYLKLKREYKRPLTPIKGFAAPYFIPYLNLYSKTYSDTVKEKPAPPYKAALQLWVEIQDADVDKIELEFNKDIFTINGKKDGTFSVSTKTHSASLQKSDEITITCLKDIAKDEKIVAYAHFKNSEGEQKKEIAGELLVCKNDETVRKKTKFVFVRVKTNVGGGEPMIGKFTQDEHERLQNVLYQSLVCPSICVGKKYLMGLITKDVVLDLSNDSNFKPRGLYMVGNDIDFDDDEMLKYIKRKFMRDNPQYKEYFPIFAFEEDGGFAGRVEDIGEKNVILLFNRNSKTCPHEALHGFNLWHTHRERGESVITEPNKKYIFPHAHSNSARATDNMMSYNGNKRKTTWKWQWEILRRYV